MPTRRLTYLEKVMGAIDDVRDFANWTAHVAASVGKRLGCNVGIVHIGTSIVQSCGNRIVLACGRRKQKAVERLDVELATGRRSAALAAVDSRRRHHG